MALTIKISKMTLKYFVRRLLNVSIHFFTLFIVISLAQEVVDSEKLFLLALQCVGFFFMDVCVFEFSMKI